jgi:hypothetical protein
MLKKLAAVCAAATALFVLSAAPAHASVGDFLGQWTNTDAAADGVTRVAVSRTGAALRLRVFGRCHPTDCDWGQANAVAFAPGAGGNVENDATTVMAVFNQSFARKTVIVRLTSAGLTYEVLTEFTDSSGRANYVERGRLTRAATGGGGGGAVAEDCIGFTPGNLRVSNVGGRWKIVEGAHYVADFGSNRAAAEQGLAIILRYGFTMQCFVARPNPPMTYWRRGAGVPSLPTGSGEDCNAINPANVRAQNVGGAWKVVDGSSWLLDFGSNRDGAEQAVNIIQRYHLNRQCFVARPSPPMTYWLSRP